MTWTVAHVAALLAGAGLAGAGVWLLWGRRVLGTGAGADANGSPEAGAPGVLSPAMRTVLGLCLLLVGYHAAAYASPASWFPLQIPRERWWILAGGVALALLGTRVTDRLEAS